MFELLKRFLFLGNKVVGLLALLLLLLHHVLRLNRIQFLVVAHFDQMLVLGYKLVHVLVKHLLVLELHLE